MSDRKPKGTEHQRAEMAEEYTLPEDKNRRGRQPHSRHSDAVGMDVRIGPTFMIGEDGQTVEWFYRRDAADLTTEEAAVIAQIQVAKIIASAISDLAAAVERLADSKDGG